MDSLHFARLVLLYGFITMLAAALPTGGLPDCYPKWDTKPGKNCPDKGY